MIIIKKISLFILSVFTLLGLSLTPAFAYPTTPMPPFTQCPAIGADTSCAFLIVLNRDGTTTVLHDASQGPFDTVEDSLVGIQNNTGESVSKIQIAGTGIFAFDGDGICSGFNPPNPSGCPFGSTGYEGPHTSFSVTDVNNGSILFTGGLKPGASTYVGLEGNLSEHAITVGVLKGTMTGGGMIGTTGEIHAFELNCDMSKFPNNLVVAWGKGNTFHLHTLSSAFCYNDPSINSGKPYSGFNTYQGAGTGMYNGVQGYTAKWTFTDAGEPGVNDRATISIYDPTNVLVATFDGNLSKGNQQAHQ